MSTNEQAPPPPPPPEAEVFPPLLKCTALIAAGQLGLFKALVEGPRSVPEIASMIGAPEFGVARLVEALAALGYLESTDGGYANGPVARAWLTPASRADYSALLLFAGEAWPFFGNLANVVRRGVPEPTTYQVMEEHPHVGRFFSQYMKANAQLWAAPIADMVGLPGAARRLLDLGGSHGLYSLAFCRRHPNLKAVVFDLPSALSETEAIIASGGLSDRVSVQRGDFFQDDIGQGYDVVLLFGIVDGNNAADNRRLAAKVAAALNPGGLVIVHNHLRPDPLDAFNAIFSLAMFSAYGTRTYNFDEITGWLAEAGFGSFSRTSVPPTGQTSIITAIKSS